MDLVAACGTRGLNFGLNSVVLVRERRGFYTSGLAAQKKRFCEKKRPGFRATAAAAAPSQSQSRRLLRAAPHF